MRQHTLVLASTSPRRRQLLHDAGYKFLVRPSNVEEPDPTSFHSPEAYAIHTAWLKANALAQSSHPTDDATSPIRHSREIDASTVAEPTHPMVDIVLAADTIVAADAQVLGKPSGRPHAEQILRALMGTRHRVITGLAIMVPSRRLTLVDHVTSWVTMRHLSDADLQRYLDSENWQGKAGAYGIQDRDDPFITQCEGSFSNVIGLPMERLAELLPLAARIADQL